MDYYCNDCSYRGGSFVSGACPACGSRNVRRAKPTAKQQMKARKPYRLWFCVALWIWLAQEIWRKLNM